MNDKYIYEITLSNGVVADVYSKCDTIQNLIMFNTQEWAVFETITDNNDIVVVAYRVSSIVSIRQFPIPE